jgi:hypothetical protein
MKSTTRTTLLLSAAIALSGCATSAEMGWQHPGKGATETQLASCDAGTATLKDKHDHKFAHRACLDAKVRQQLTD